jgi:PNKP adenylyltransferase domain, ligase domain
MWHLGVADRLVAADSELVAPTQHVFVNTTDPVSVGAATDWWSELTSVGGEGMVVQPAANLSRGRKGLVQPGLKVRGPEYLRITYGPDYTEPANLERLRPRGLGHKRSLALREIRARSRGPRSGRARRAAVAGTPVRVRGARARI